MPVVSAGRMRGIPSRLAGAIAHGRLGRLGGTSGGMSLLED